MGRPVKQSRSRPAGTGIAGAALSVLGSAVDKVGELPRRDRGPTLWLIVVVAFAIVVVTVAGWIATHSGTTVTGAACGQTGAGAISGGSVSCGAIPEKAK